MRGLKNVRIYTKEFGIIKTDISFKDGIITHIGNCPTSMKVLANFDDALVCPGFIDQHIHGAGGSDAMDGSFDALSTIACTVASEGTTSFLATTMTQSPENIKNACTAVNQYMQQNPCTGAEILGIHLEGPFISPKNVGAQPLGYVAPLDTQVFDEYNNASGGNIKLVTLAVDMPNSSQFIRHLKSQNIVASVGHSKATFLDIEKATECGLGNVTHTYNAQTPLHHREVGVVGSAMLIDSLNCEIICDCIHVCENAIKLLIKNKPKDKVTLVTDAMRAKGLPDGLSELGGQQVIVKDGQARLVDGTLAGSVLKMNVAIKNLVTRVGISLTDAIDMATINPAKNLGVDSKLGSIEVGKQANFAILDNSFNVLMTIKNGEVIYKK